MSLTRLPRGEVREDYHPTPPSVTRALLRLLHVGAVFDPCAGKGEILDVVRAEWGVDAAGYEISARRGGAGIAREDALRVAWPPATYILNPPFSLAFEFTCNAVRYARAYGTTAAVLVRLGFFEAKARAEWNRANPCDVYVISPRPRFVGGKSDSAAYGWAIWGPGRGGRFGILTHSQVSE